MFKHPTMGDIIIIIIIIQHIFVVGIYTEGNISFTIGGSQSKFFLHSVQQPGPYWDRSSGLPLGGLEPHRGDSL